MSVELSGLHTKTSKPVSDSQWEVCNARSITGLYLQGQIVQ
jgi:hypothetical protein